MNAEERRAQQGHELVLQLQRRGKLPELATRSPAGAAWGRAAVAVLQALGASSTPASPGGVSVVDDVKGKLLAVVSPGGVDALVRGDVAGAVEAAAEQHMKRVQDHVIGTIRGKFETYDKRRKR